MQKQRAEQAFTRLRFIINNSVFLYIQCISLPAARPPAAPVPDRPRRRQPLSLTAPAVESEEQADGSRSDRGPVEAIYPRSTRSKNILRHHICIIISRGDCYTLSGCSAGTVETLRRLLKRVSIVRRLQEVCVRFFFSRRD